MDKLNSQYIVVKKSIQSKKTKLNNITYSCIQPKWLKCYRIRKLLDELKQDIKFLENYNITILNNSYYLPQAEILLHDTENLQYEYMNKYSILKIYV